MRGIRFVLTAKILVTVFFWALPLLLLPESLFVYIGFPEPNPKVFVQLLGMAYASLAVGYAMGLKKANSNTHPVEAVWVGIVSNGGAAIILGVNAIVGTWSNWGPIARIYMWSSLVAVTLITLGLLLNRKETCHEQAIIRPDDEPVH